MVVWVARAQRALGRPTFLIEWRRRTQNTRAPHAQLHGTTLQARLGFTICTEKGYSGILQYKFHSDTFCVEIVTKAEITNGRECKTGKSPYSWKDAASASRRRHRGANAARILYSLKQSTVSQQSTRDPSQFKPVRRGTSTCTARC